ncbi:hypothetical protein HZA97_02415 [Candidatus Woesearchaeota archaeon]|nr:hypothetical protein [Candidatus Woesearchaeota archaeon]
MPEIVSVLTSIDVFVVRVTLAIIIGTLAAIVYCLRFLVLMERRLERIEMHTGNMVGSVLREEYRIEKGLKGKPKKK